MRNIKIKTTSLFTLSIAALALSGCKPETPVFDPAEKGWELVFADEFEGSVIDDNKWAFEVNCWGGGNNEEQCYVDDPDNAYVDNGVLTIKAIREEFTGPIYNPDDADYDPNELSTKAFTSARLRSVSPLDYSDGQVSGFNFKHDWKYGRFEIRAKLPEGQGTWPAIWMLPTDWAFGGWAMSGEIDIMEAVNLKADYVDEESGETKVENRVHGTLHYGRAWPGNVYTGVEYDFDDASINPADDFHIYSIEWEEGAIRWFVDNQHFATQTQEGWFTHYQDENGVWQSSGTSAAPFDQNFHLILNLAIGGAWAANVNEGGVDAAINEAAMQVDYVRVYQCAEDASGIACGTKGKEGSYTLESGVVEPDLPIAADFDADPLVIFGSKLAGDWQMAKWDDADGGDEYQLIDGAIDLQFNNTGVMYLYGDQGKTFDMTPYGGGDYRFKLRWLDGMATGLTVGFSDTSGGFAYIVLDQQYFGEQGADGWTDVSIPVADMLLNAPGFDLSQIEIPGKFEQTGGTDLHVQIKDLEITKGDYIPVEVNPLGYELELLTDVIGEGFDAYLYQGYGEPSDDNLSVVDGVMSGRHNGGGNISIGSVSGAMDLSDFSEGQLHFDLRVIDQGNASDILVKMDGGWPNVGDVALSETNTGLPSDEQWYSYHINVADFVNNNNRLDGSGVFSLAQVINPFVIEAFAGGDLQVDVRNVRFTRPLNLLSSEIATDFDAYLYHGYNEAATDTISVLDGVLNGTHEAGGNISIGAASGTIDISSLANANVVFDLRIVDQGTATDVLIKIDSGWPNVGDVALSETSQGLPVNSDWVSYAIPVSDFLANNNRLDGSGVLNLNAVINAFVVEAFNGGYLQVEVRHVSYQF
ncbi:family 16 glycosylhydrolase [Reinekea sp.]|jgi:beta-glucanase (GH16 family)|uniref:glycoside hydrolase family 16 protein n=1 Tax=Reinekea sp. TaxID=1970455 RepID=UPI003989C3FC